MYSRLFYPWADKLSDVWTKTKEMYKDMDLTDEELSELNRAYKVSRHKKVFQDVYMKVGVVNIEEVKSNWDEILIRLRKYIDEFPQTVNWVENNHISKRGSQPK